MQPKPGVAGRIVAAAARSMALSVGGGLAAVLVP